MLFDISFFISLFCSHHAATDDVNCWCKTTRRKYLINCCVVKVPWKKTEKLATHFPLSLGVWLLYWCLIPTQVVYAHSDKWTFVFQINVVEFFNYRLALHSVHPLVCFCFKKPLFFFLDYKLSISCFSLSPLHTM